MDDTQNVVNDATVVESAENTASEQTVTEQTAESNTDTSAEKQNTESVESAGSESKEGLESKSVPYYRLQEVIAERNQMRQEIEALKNNSYSQAPQVQQDEQEVLAKQALEKLGYVDRTYVETKISEAIAQDRVYRELDQKVQQLSKEWDGKDGKPKFDVDDVIEYGKNVGVYDPEAAFKLMNEKPLAEYWAKQAKLGLKTERQGKPVQNVGADEDALRKEAIESGDFTKLLKLRLKR
jgi:hypothetical protein